MNSALPTRFCTGTKPTPLFSGSTRLSLELSRLSPIANTYPSGTRYSGVVFISPLSVSLRIGCSRPFGSVSMYSGCA